MNELTKKHFAEIERYTARNLSTATPFQGYTGWIVVERGIGLRSETGLVIPPSAASEGLSLVLAVGSEVKFGLKVGDWLVYQQGVNLKMQGPNGGTLFVVTEREVCAVIPPDGRKVEKAPEEKNEVKS